eukprot:CAMPEP_0174898206 /NCGR_PEP_ID=MMETSP0167-20121228/20056_1 /TAXON_ID=38298 /ORGANISM="Rhodella maculata, Strain CCMP736" /LENGTH=59 /DNA_ID=CAMNT_0016138685 /DNA_START=39 /DNA_END=215 /DNA_ORIENTATION=-
MTPLLPPTRCRSPSRILPQRNRSHVAESGSFSDLRSNSKNCASSLSGASEPTNATPKAD